MHGNLTKRRDERKGKEESFEYDNLDRLTRITGPVNQELFYAGNGNISSKTDAGNYTYDGSKINAVSSVTNPATVIPSRGRQASSRRLFTPPTSSQKDNGEQ